MPNQPAPFGVTTEPPLRELTDEEVEEALQAWGDSFRTLMASPEPRPDDLPANVIWAVDRFGN